MPQLIKIDNHGKNQQFSFLWNACLQHCNTIDWLNFNEQYGQLNNHQGADSAAQIEESLQQMQNES
jgi:hypothetical protein